MIDRGIAITVQPADVTRELDLAFRRHADYLTLAYRANTGPVRRLQNKLKTMLARSHG